MSSSTDEAYKTLSLDESLNYRESRHASHCLIYAQFECDTYYALVQLRFDGLIGFAGGEVDDTDITVNAIIDATNRELREEVNYSYDSVTKDEWICTDRLVRNNNDWVQHFFAKQLTANQFRELERNHLYAQHFPSESLGVFRVPIGEKGRNSSKTASKFLPNFLRQTFSGNARQQFVNACIKLDLICPGDRHWVEEVCDQLNKVDITDDSSANCLLKKCMLYSMFDVKDYHDETVTANYGLMVIHSDGCFDFININDRNNDQNQLISEDICIDRNNGTQIKLTEINLNGNDDSNETNNRLFLAEITCEQFSRIESTFTFANNFVGNSVFGIFRIPLSFVGHTVKADNYLLRFFNGYVKQLFSHKSKQLFIDMLLNSNSEHNLVCHPKVIDFIRSKVND